VTGGPQQLVVSGTSGANGSYAGTVSFTPSVGAVPEPAAWALMIMGFGGAGAMLRRRRQADTHATA
jgi:PEP-CTERM motif